MAEVFVGSDVTGDGVNDADITPSGSFVNIGGVIFTDAVNTGSGTGNYNTFLAISDNDGIEEGFNSDDTPPIDDSNENIDHAKTHTVKLSDLVIVTVDGVQYYEFRVDLNESNSDPNAQISLDQFKLYSSANGGITDTTTLFSQNLIYDMDAGGNKSVLMSDAESSGSGNDDYAVLVPITEFAGLDPTTTYVYLFVQMGAADPVDPDTWDATATFEEWNLQNGVTLTGTKFEDLDGDGIRDAGEGPVEGVTIFIDANKNGVLDAGERTTVTDADGNYTFYGVATGQEVWIDEVVPDGANQTTGTHEVVTIDDNATPGSTVVVDPIGNFIPHPAISINKLVHDVDGDTTDPVVDAAGDVVNYTITITNTGNVTLTGLLTEDQVEALAETSLAPVLSGGFNTGDTNTNGAFDPGETWNFTASYTVTQDDMDGNGGGDSILSNIARATTNQTAEVEDPAEVGLIYNPDFTVTKVADSITGGQGTDGLDGADSDGDIVNYTITIDNIGNITLTGFLYTDANTDGDVITYVSGDGDGDGDLDVDETWIYSATHTVTQDELDSPGTDNSGALDTDGDTDNRVTVSFNEAGPKNADAVTPLIYNPDFTVTKVADSITGGQGTDGLDGADSDGDIVNYTITIDNIGNITLTGFLYTDANTDGDVITYVSGDGDGDGDLDVDETWIYSATHTVTQDELDSPGTDNSGALDTDGDTDNRVTVSFNEAGPKNADAVTPLIYNPLIDLEKLVSVDSTDGTDGSFVDADAALGPQNVNLGTDVWFKVTVENSGNVTLTDVDIVDNNTTTGMPGTFFDLVVDGALTQDAIDNYGATLSGDDDGDGFLDVDETWTITYKQAFDPGNHVNTAFVTTAEGAEDDDPAHYFSLIDLGPCPRTPGFWQNPKNGGQFWDGILGNEKNAGQPGFADGELLYAVDSNNNGVINGSDQKGLLIGDYNKNGLTDLGLDGIANTGDEGEEDTLFVSYADARSLINASNKQLNGLSGDGKFMLGRDMVATWLNYLAGTNIGDASDTQSPHHYIDDSIDWMQIYSGNANGGANEMFDSLKLSGPAIKTNSAIWNTEQSGFDHSAAEMHSALDYYNNTGQTEPGGTIYAHCESPEFFAAIQAYNLV